MEQHTYNYEVKVPLLTDVDSFITMYFYFILLSYTESRIQMLNE